MADKLRLSGIVSGYDTAQLIEQLMAVERRPVVALQDRQSKLKTKSDAWKDVANRLNNLRSTAAALKNASVFGARKVSSSKDSAVTATAASDAAPGVYKVWVDRLATSTKAAGTVRMGRGVDLNVKLADAGFALSPTAGVFTINGVQIRIDADTVLSDGVDGAQSNSILGKINSSQANVTASFADNRLTIVSNTGEAVRLGSGGDTSNFLTAARLLGAASGASVTSQGVLGVVKSTTALASARLATAPVHSVLGAVVEGASEGKLEQAVEAGSVVEFTRGGESYSVTLDGGDDMAAIAADLEAKMNAAAGLDAGTIRVRVSGIEGERNDRLVITDTSWAIGSGDGPGGVRFAQAPAALGLTAEAGASNKGLLKVNGVAIEYDSLTHAVNDILARINSSSANVTVGYDALDDRMTMAARYTGEISIALEDVGGNFLEAAGILNAKQDFGHNALYRIDGVNGGQQLSSASNTIAGVITGVTMNLREAGESPVTVTVTHDVDSAVAAVRSFVEQYNSVVGLLATQTAYDKETKTAGTMQGDSSIRSIQYALRQMISTSADDLPAGFRSLMSIGVSTGAAGSRNGTSGQLVIDEARLKAAIQSNPQAVNELFAHDTQGFSVKLESFVSDLTRANTGTISLTQKVIQDETRSITQSIESIERRLEKRRETLVAQFTQMEKALSSMAQQQQWMDAQFSSMG